VTRGPHSCGPRFVSEYCYVWLQSPEPQNLFRQGEHFVTDRGTPILELLGVNKSFGPVHVLHDVDFQVFPGKVTALVGDNGAGKSTLIKCVTGIYPVDTGEFRFNGKVVNIKGPKDAASLGIEVVYQDLALCDNLDIVQNMFLGREQKRGGLLDERTMERKARETLASLSVRTVKSVHTPVSSLSGGQRQTVAIAKAVLWNSKVVMLDEPTAALGVAQTRQVLDLVRRLADQGLGVVLISHNMNDVLEVADRVSAMYLGRVAADVAISELHPVDSAQIIADLGQVGGAAEIRDRSRKRLVDLITSGRSGDIGLKASEI
jgi:D-xylose transport system ATP-binding protein